MHIWTEQFVNTMSNTSFHEFVGVSDDPLCDDCTTPEAVSIWVASSADVTGADVSGSCSSLLAKRVFKSDTVKRFISSSLDVPTAEVASIESNLDGEPGRSPSDL